MGLKTLSKMAKEQLSFFGLDTLVHWTYIRWKVQNDFSKTSKTTSIRPHPFVSQISNQSPFKAFWNERLAHEGSASTSTSSFSSCSLATLENSSGPPEKNGSFFSEHGVKEVFPVTLYANFHENLLFMRFSLRYHGKSFFF